MDLERGEPRTNDEIHHVGSGYNDPEVPTIDNNIDYPPHIHDAIPSHGDIELSSKVYESRINMFRHGPVREVIIIEREPTLADFIPRLVAIAVYALIIQTFFTVWKKVNKRSYNICVFFILVLFPPSLFLYAQSYFLPICWVVFSGFMMLSVVRVLKDSHNKDAMRNTYATFKTLFIISNIGVFVGQSFTFIFFYLRVEFLRYSLMILLFFLYFGLLSREIIFFLSEVMATATGFYSKDGVPGKGNNNSLCMICTKMFDGKEKIHTLVCSHSFHEDCIKGWCLLGKKSFCPYCKKKVEGSSLPTELWHKAETWFYPLINTLRSFIVFTLVLTAIVLYKINYQ